MIAIGIQYDQIPTFIATVNVFAKFTNIAIHDRSQRIYSQNPRNGIFCSWSSINPNSKQCSLFLKVI